jgi:hypothetical protein
MPNRKTEESTAHLTEAIIFRMLLVILPVQVIGLHPTFLTLMLRILFMQDLRMYGKAQLEVVYGRKFQVLQVQEV